MALVMDFPQMGERYEVKTLCSAGGVGGGGKRYRLQLVRYRLQLLMGANPLLGPLEGVGVENQDFLGP
jgi:hypothetical protein